MTELQPGFYKATAKRTFSFDFANWIIGESYRLVIGECGFYLDCSPCGMMAFVPEALPQILIYFEVIADTEVTQDD